QRVGRAPTYPRPPQRPRPSSTSLQSSTCKAVSRRTVGRGKGCPQARCQRKPRPISSTTCSALATELPTHPSTHDDRGRGAPLTVEPLTGQQILALREREGAGQAVLRAT